MADSSSLYVARETDLEALKAHWAAARVGSPRGVLLSAPLGGGKRALVGELARAAAAEDDDVLVWRVAMSDEEDGLRALLRIYAALFAGLHRSPVFRGKVEMALNSQLPSQTRRVQGWYQAFIDALKKGAPKPGEQQFQVTLPKDNPLVGLVEIAHGIARKFPVLIELQNLHLCQSLAVHALVEALMAESKGCKMMVVLGVEPVTDAAKTWFSRPLTDMFERRADLFKAVDVAPWGAEEVGKYLTSKGWTGDAAAIATLANGRPGFVAEISDWLHESGRLEGDLSGLTLGGIADVAPDASELDAPEEDATEGENKRKYATAEDAERVAYVAALLGLAFPSGLVADIAGYNRDSVDDLLDATEAVYKELQFSQPLGTWIYQFKRPLLRESVLARHSSDEDHEVARRVGLFIERFLAPRGFEFLSKALRLYGEHGAAGRANQLRSQAMSSDRPETWAMAQELLKYFDEIAWPDAMIRTVYMNLLERMVQSGDVNQTEALYNQAMQWATDKADRNLQAWLLFAGSRLDFRRQDLYRARDRANDALKMLLALEDKVRAAEVHTHLAMIDLQDGSPNAALDHVTTAESLTDAPAIAAHAEYVRGTVSMKERKLPAAVEHFRRANEIAGTAGHGALALESGLHYGEALLVSGQHTKAADVLGRVVQIARSLQNPVRERGASALLSQAQGALKNHEAALTAAQRTLELTRALKFTKFEPIDLYNVGFFQLLLGRANEAVVLFRQARTTADSNDSSFMKELLFNLGAAQMQIGEKSGAEEALKAALPHANKSSDWRKVVAASEQLAALATERGNNNAAKALLEQALKAADRGDLKDARKGLRRKLDALES